MLDHEGYLTIRSSLAEGALAQLRLRVPLGQEGIGHAKLSCTALTAGRRRKSGIVIGWVKQILNDRMYTQTCAIALVLYT